MLEFLIYRTWAIACTVIGQSNCFGLVLRHSTKTALKTNEEVFTDKLI